MRCEQARQLFDAYLDGELPPSLVTELGAHRLRCPECRRALALLEVTGHVIARDREPTSLRPGFSERLLACTASPPQRMRRSWVSKLYVAGPLAAAAVVLLALLGVFDRGNTRIAGETVRRTRSETISPQAVPDIIREQVSTDRDARDDDPVARTLEQWAHQAQQTLADRRRSSESLQQLLDLKMTQFLDMLKQPASVPGSEEPEAAEEEANTPADPEEEPVDDAEATP